jgi:hypothetical protein
MLKVNLDIQKEKNKIKNLTSEIELLQLECTVSNINTESQFYRENIEALTGERLEKERQYQLSKFSD